MPEWCTIESDPGVFSELIQKIGVNGVIVDELYSLDDIAATGPCHGLVFLFQYQRSEGKDDRAVIPPGDLPDVFFAKQTVSNACATQAILSILLNRDDVELPPVLADIKSFAPNVPPDVRGDMIGDSDVIRTVHNSFAHPDPFDVEATLPTKKSKAFHFVAYVPVKGTVYELDGLKRGPIAVGHGVSEDTWLSAAGDAIRDRIARLSQGEQLHYSLLALVPDKTDELQARLMSLEGADEPDELKQAREELAAHERKVAGWTRENAQRRHNYFPFIIALTKALAADGKLADLMKAAETVTQRKREAAIAREKASKAAKGDAAAAAATGGAPAAGPK